MGRQHGDMRMIPKHCTSAWMSGLYEKLLDYWGSKTRQCGSTVVVISSTSTTVFLLLLLCDDELGGRGDVLSLVILQMCQKVWSVTVSTHCCGFLLTKLLIKASFDYESSRSEKRWISFCKSGHILVHIYLPPTLNGGHPLHNRKITFITVCINITPIFQ